MSTHSTDPNNPYAYAVSDEAPPAVQMEDSVRQRGKSGLVWAHPPPGPEDGVLLVLSVCGLSLLLLLLAGLWRLLQRLLPSVLLGHQGGLQVVLLCVLSDWTRGEAPMKHVSCQISSSPPGLRMGL